MSRKVVFPFVVVLWLLLKCEPGRAEDNASSNASNAVAAVEAAAAAAVAASEVAASEVATPAATPVAAEVAPAEAPSRPVSAPGSNANPASTSGITSTSTSGIDPSELPIKYWGNSGSGKFHRPSCPFAKAMNSRHVVLFHFRHEAVEAGQQPCRYCLPPFVKHVECVLLPKTAKTAGSDSDKSVASVKMAGSGVTEANSSRQ